MAAPTVHKAPNRRIKTRRSPRRGFLGLRRRRKARRRGPVRRFLRRFWWAWTPLALAFLLGTGTLTYLYITIPLPAERPLQQTTFLLDRFGERLTFLEAEVDRRVISLHRMPDHLRQAVLAAEDSRFYSHPGVSPIDIVRAGWADITGGRIEQGASTITQQLVRNVFPEVGTERTITRKVKEAILALKLERELDKDEILERYLNTVYFGSGAYGVQAASRTYFGKAANNLTLPESATLAGVISRPEFYSPNRNPAEALARRNRVLSAMAGRGYISDAEAAVAEGQPLDTVTFEEGFADDPSAWFIDYARQWLTHPEVSPLEDPERQTFEGGLRIRTTVDQEWQRAAIQAIRDNVAARSGFCVFPEELGGPRECAADAALVAIDPRNGAVRAVASSLDYSPDPDERLFHPATFGCDLTGCPSLGGTGRQTGSAFKIFTNAAFVEAGHSLRSTFSGRSPVIFDEPPCGNEIEPWDPENFGGASFGAMDIFGATRSSVNTIFAQMIDVVGPDKVADIAERLGIHSRLSGFCSMTLGAAEVNLLEMTTAFAAIGSGGVLHEPTPVRAIRTPDGEVVWRNTGEGERVMDANDAYQVRETLEGVMFGTGSGAYFGVPSYGKTGSEDNRTDAWFCGGTTEIVTCVWVGRHEAQIPVGSITGGGAAVPVWRQFMEFAHQHLTPGSFPEAELTGEIVKPKIPLPSPTPSPTPKKKEKEKPKKSPKPPPSPSPPPPSPPPPPPTTPPPTTPPPSPTGPTGPLP